MPPEVCPHCGADVPPNARACPGCGADEHTGWSEEAAASGLNLPDEEFDYEGFVEEEFGTKKSKPRGVRWIWWAVGAALAALLIWRWIR